MHIRQKFNEIQQIFLRDPVFDPQLTHIFILSHRQLFVCVCDFSRSIGNALKCCVCKFSRLSNRCHCIRSLVSSCWCRFLFDFFSLFLCYLFYHIIFFCPDWSMYDQIVDRCMIIQSKQLQKRQLFMWWIIFISHTQDVILIAHSKATWRQFFETTKRRFRANALNI